MQLSWKAYWRGIRERFAELRLPRFSPSLTVWFLIGGGYYIICFAVLYRLLRSDLPSRSHKTAWWTRRVWVLNPT
ncbi:MAG: hypothetical protein ACREMI_07945 [Gemmatimonadales bacterium]